jgi:hypothetical protein
MKEKQKILLAFSGLAWTGLGMYRGSQEYNKRFNKDVERYLKDPKYYDQPKYYYTSLIGQSIVFGCLYLVTAPGAFLYREIYKFEDFIRGRENNE